ncbi:MULTISPECIES: YbaB/EbfC family nucleoid-associated protein [Mycolicibacterium]|uniref:YbaB/EbfC family nucleoid-associated protein n=1 Tax=Mycolicibacterium TaxID=1866885 RepID=UPI00261331D0|nr:YbaB/EbfC family nucleoid-associated protein [Mycolicibacterium fortuitum]
MTERPAEDVNLGLAGSLVERIIKQRDLMQAMSEHYRSTSARVTSKDQSVSVEVDGIGTLKGLWIADNAFRHGPEALARLIVDTAAAAAKVALDRQNFLVEQFNSELAGLQASGLKKWDGTIFTPQQ